MTRETVLEDLRDEALLPRIAGGDDRALGEVYDRYGGLCYALAVNITGEEADAQDAVAEAFHQLWRTAASFEADRGSVRSWLCTITRTRALDLVRARGRRARAAERSALTHTDGIATPTGTTELLPDRAAEASELRTLVSRALSDLPDPQRQALELWYMGGLSHAEIAAEIDEPLGTVKTRLRSALSRLKHTLGPILGEAAR